jgi:hypothetical protein
MALESLLMPALMGFVLVLLVWRISNIRDWRDYEISGSSRSNTSRFLEWLWSSPTAWMLTFVVAAVGVTVVGILAVSQGSLVSMATGTLLQVVLAAMIGLMGLFLFFGTYFSIRSRGAANSMAAVLSALMMGFVILALVSLRIAGIL